MQGVENPKYLNCSLTCPQKNLPSSSVTHEVWYFIKLWVILLHFFWTAVASSIISIMLHAP